MLEGPSRNLSLALQHKLFKTPGVDLYMSGEEDLQKSHQARPRHYFWHAQIHQFSEMTQNISSWHLLLPPLALILVHVVNNLLTVPPVIVTQILIPIPIARIT
jgi:hypothetical protein